MNEKFVNRRVVTMIGSVALLAVSLLLPLVNLMSYRYILFDLPHKIQRLLHSGTEQAIAYVLFSLLLLSPLVLLLVTALKKHAPAWLAGLPALSVGVLTILLLLADKPSPGVGLWIYLVIALAIALWNER